MYILTLNEYINIKQLHIINDYNMKTRIKANCTKTSQFEINPANFG